MPVDYKKRYIKLCRLSSLLVSEVLRFREEDQEYDDKFEKLCNELKEARKVASLWEFTDVSEEEQEEQEEQEEEEQKEEQDEDGSSEESEQDNEDGSSEESEPEEQEESSVSKHGLTALSPNITYKSS